MCEKRKKSHCPKKRRSYNARKESFVRSEKDFFIFFLFFHDWEEGIWSFYFVPSKENSHANHTLKIFVQHNRKLNIGGQSVTKVIIYGAKHAFKRLGYKV